MAFVSDLSLLFIERCPHFTEVANVILGEMKVSCLVPLTSQKLQSIQNIAFECPVT